MHYNLQLKNLILIKMTSKNAEKLVGKTMSLPVHEFINNEQIKYVSDFIREFFI